MCAFEINFFSRKQEFHRFSTDDFALLEIGIGNYTRSSLGNFFSYDTDRLQQKKPLNPDIAEFFSGMDPSVIIRQLTGEDLNDSMEIMAYDEDEKKYKLKKGFSEIIKINATKFKPDKYASSIPQNNLKDFLAKWNDVQVGIVTDPKLINSYKLIANRIQNSASGCITFDTTLNILNTERKSPIKLFLLNSRDSDSSRTVSFNDSPFISAIPQTAEGMRYGHQNTLNAGTGAYEKISGNDNPQDKVAGKMRLVWDPANKTWESGTQQVLARLVDAIDATPIPEINGEQLLNLGRQENYDVSPDENPIMGKPKIGRAVVVSTENGNPNLFGANFRGGCADNTKKSIIKVVNRSAKAYKEGTLVVCSLINGEWIIVSGEGTASENKRRISFGRFEHQQYLIPANLYFTSPQNALRLLPDNWTSKIRDDYYIRSVDITNEDRILNLIAKIVPPESEDPAQFILDEYKNKTRRTEAYTEAQNNRIIDGMNALDFISINYCEPGLVPNFGQDPLEYTFGIPKNALAKSNRTTNLGLPNVLSVASDPIDKNEIPLFWGVLFPDGYQSSQTAKFFADSTIGTNGLKKLKIFKDDRNLREMSIGAMASLPYITSEEETLAFVFNDPYLKELINDYLNINPISLVRKTGCWSKNISMYDTLDPEILSDIVAGTSRRSYQFGFGPSLTYGVYGLEPLNPARIQFTPMSIEALYLDSTLSNNEFTTLKNNIGIKNNGFPDGAVLDSSKKLLDYYKSLFINENSNVYSETVTDEYFQGNTYSLSPLSFSKSFDGNTGGLIARHPSPNGVVAGDTIIPPYRGDRRSPAMPVIALKSVIKTNSQSITFTVPQFFGNPPKNVVSPGSGPQVTILPIGGGIGWNTPGTPVTVNSSPQWGDRNRTDDIDSFGTVALHAKVYEHWPEKQTIFLGPIYTPLHFNHNVETYKYKYAFDIDSGNVTETPVLNDDGQPIENISQVDFKVPSYKLRTEGVGEFVFEAYVGDKFGAFTPYQLLPVSEWKSSKIRRGKLLSGGGFAYFKKVLYIASVLLKYDQEGNPINTGSGYSDNDEFLFPDGTTFKVKVDKDGKITRIHNIVVNFDSEHVVIDQSKYLGFTSLNIQPDYLGSSGSGALFDFDVKVGVIVGYDKAPKEVVPSTRLTSSSSNGANVVEKTNTVTVDFNDTNKNEFDIFYFFHNDPTAYSIDAFLTYNNNLAQYVILEVSPG